MINHAFFSPTSRYNSFRRNERPEHKLYGYFWCRMLQDGDVKPTTVPSDHSRSNQTVAQPAPTLVMGSSPVGAYRIGGDAVAELSPPSHQTRLKEEDDQLIFKLSVGSMEIHDRPCRGLLIHWRVIEHFRRVDDRLSGQSDWDVIKAVIQDRYLDGNPKIAALLSGVPDFDGTIDHLGRIVFPAYAIPSGSPELDESTYVVIVVDDRAKSPDAGGQA